MTLIAILALVVGCGSDRRGIGAACRHANDCIEGAACNYMTCDFVEPCSVRETDGDGDSTVKTYRFDEEGRRLGWEERDGDEVVGKEVWFWSSDHRWAKVKTWMGDSSKELPDLVTTHYFDGDGLLERLDVWHGGRAEWFGYEWPDSWSCRAQRTVTYGSGGKVVAQSRPSCDEDGVVRRIDYLKGDSVDFTVEYVYEADRVVERVVRSRAAGAAPDDSMRFERDARGSVVKVEKDVGLDGTVELTKVYDLSCWKVEGDRVRLRSR